MRAAVISGLELKDCAGDHGIAAVGARTHTSALQVQNLTHPWADEVGNHGKAGGIEHIDQPSELRDGCYPMRASRRLNDSCAKRPYGGHPVQSCRAAMMLGNRDVAFARE